MLCAGDYISAACNPYFQACFKHFPGVRGQSSRVKGEGVTLGVFGLWELCVGRTGHQGVGKKLEQ